MKLTKQQLKQIIREELSKLHEIDDPLSSRGLPRSREIDRLRDIGANTRGTAGPPLAAQVDEPPPAKSSERFFGIFKISGGYETVTVVSDSREGIEAQFEDFDPRAPDERIAAIIRGELVEGNVDFD